MTLQSILAAEETRNPLVAAPNELVWGGICFLLLLALFWKYVMPRAEAMLRERTENIEAKLAKAEQDRADAEALLEQYRVALQQAQSEATKIRSDAAHDREQIIEKAREEAEHEARRVTSARMAQLENEISQVRNELSADIGRLVLQLAERVVGDELSDPQRAEAAVDRFLAELEQQAAAEGNN
jgi:F-type H+-transporting ATPase subunit b